MISDSRGDTSAAKAMTRNRRPLSAFDFLVSALSLGLALAVAAVGDDEPAAKQLDLVAYFLLFFGGVALIWRKRYPRIALAFVGGASLMYLALDYPGAPITVVALVALYSTAAAGRRWWSFVVVGIFALGGLVFRVLVEGEAPVTVAFTSALFVAVTLHGDAVHSRRALRHAAQEELSRAILERDRDTERRMSEERMRIARELHDVMAHTITAMSVQAAAASDLLTATTADGFEARNALASIRTTARQAMSELKATVALLRGGDQVADRSPVPSLAHLEELRQMAHQHGICFETETRGLPRTLPAAVELTAYRLAQEAVTNVVRHSNARRADLVLEHRPGRLLVTVSDDGDGPGVSPRTGFGLIGMRERVEALGGVFDSGQSEKGGFQVTASIPVVGRPSGE